MGSCLSKPKEKTVEVTGATKNVMFDKDIPPKQSSMDRINEAIKISSGGIQLVNQKRFAEARKEFESALKILEMESPNSLNVALVNENIAVTFESENNYAEAIVYFTKAASVGENVAPEKVGSYYRLLGINYRKLTKFNESQSSFLKAIEIQQRVTPNSADLALTYNLFGLLLQEQGKYEESLANFEKSLLIYSLTSTKSFESLSVKLNIGSLQSKTGNLAAALATHEQIISDLETVVPPNPDTLALAVTNMAVILQQQGKISQALEKYKSALASLQASQPDSMHIATLNVNLGTLMKSTERLGEALVHFDAAVAILAKIAPNSVNMGVAYKHIGDTYFLQGNNARAKEYHGMALAILNNLVPNTLGVAVTLNSVGDVLFAEGSSDDALTQYHKALAILEKTVPNSIYVARLCSNIGVVLRKQGNNNESFDMLMRAYEIRNRDLVPTHPDLVQLCYELAEVLLSLCEYKQGLKFADLAIAKDPRYKYAHKVKGLLLIGQDKFDEALLCFETAIAIDAGYADGQLHKIETLIAKNKALAAENSNAPTSSTESAALEAELTTAAKLEKSGFDEQYKQELVTRALSAGDTSVKIVLPTSEYEVGSASLLQKVEEMRVEVAALRVTVDEHTRQLQTIFKRLDILDNLVYSLAHSMNIIKANVSEVNASIAELKKNDPANSERMQELLAEKEKLVVREKHIKMINKHPDMRHYYHTLLSEVEAAYIAAQAIASGQVDMTAMASSNVSKAASYLSTVATLIPMVGQIASAVISKAGSLYDVYYQTNMKLELARIRDLASTVDEYDRIAVRVAVELTLRNRATIEALKGAVLPKDMKFYASIFIKQDISLDVTAPWSIFSKKDEAALKVKNNVQGGLEGLIQAYLTENDSQAKLLGRADGQKVLCFLQQDSVAENLCYEDFDDAAAAVAASADKYKSRVSFIAEKIAANVQ